MNNFELFGGEECDNYKEFKSIGEFILQKLTNGGDNVALINGVTKQEYTHSQIMSDIKSFATILREKFGISNGDKVAVVSENRIEFQNIILSTLLLNAAIVPINVTYSEREIAHALDLTKPKIIFTSPIAKERVVNVAKSLDYVKSIVLFGKDTDSKASSMIVTSWEEFLTDSDSEHFKAETCDIYSTIAAIVCSSGTTGKPKGVQLTQSNLMAGNQLVFDIIAKYLAIPEEERRLLTILPLFHVSGFVFSMGSILMGTVKTVFLAKFDPVHFLESIQNYKVSFTFVVPPIVVFLAKHPIVDKYNLSSLKFMLCAAASLKASLEEAVKDRLKTGLVVSQGYGLSETTCAILYQTKLRKAGSVGEVIPGQWIKVVDENGKSLGPNQTGELLVKGTIIMHSYINNEKDTKEMIDKDGWLHTGDCGYYDDDKQFFIVDRIKEIIKYKGYQVPPAEIEELLLQHPAVKDSAVIGIEDEEAGELPMAFIVKQIGADVTEIELQEFVGKQTSKAKHLHGGVRFIDEIPKNASGKILRRILHEILKKPHD